MKKTIDGNTAVGMIAYKLSEVIPIYPITPSSPMAEYCDGELSKGKKNIFGTLPTLVEMQSEGGASGALHGSLTTGALSTTFTSSQGLLLMIPNLYKLAGEHLPAVLHVAARTVATHALSIFGDHSDVMAIRQTGAILLASNSVQEAHDFALIAHILALKTSLPVVHFFDGFRTSHEIQKIETISDEQIKALLPNEEIRKFKSEAINSKSPYQKGSAQNPDVFFQNREASAPSYTHVSKVLKEVLSDFKRVTGRGYSGFEYVGKKNAENVIVSMSSSCECLEEVLADKKFASTALLKVHLYRPFAYEEFKRALPKSVKKVITLDRTREFGARDPLYLDVSCALAGTDISVLGGRYGLGGKDFTPDMAVSVINNFEMLKDNFTVGIEDDVSASSLPKSNYSPLTKNFQMKFYGLGSDGTVSASKSTIKILGEELDKYVQGYFEYDSKKSGSLTKSHIRVSDSPIKSTYLVHECDVISINNFSFVHRYDCLEGLKNGGTVLFNTIFRADEIDKVLPAYYKRTLKEKNAKVFCLNAQKISESVGLGNKINIIMQTALFRVSNIIDFNDAYKEIERYVELTYGKKGKSVVTKNLKAMEKTVENIEEVDVKSLTTSGSDMNTKKIDDKFYNLVMKKIERLQGDEIPVSAFDKSGKVPQGTADFEKRGFASHLPKYLPANCIQCGQCIIACPHNAIKAVLVKAETMEEVEFSKAFGMNGYLYRVQVSSEDCTGCCVCANVCPSKNKALVMHMANELLEEEKKNYAFCKTLKTEKNTPFSTDLPKGLQFRDCYFGFSGACGGCGETPYIKLATMLFGERMLIANATGCSSIYGGSFPSCPYFKDENGNGPAWANSLFEDNAEFGLGMKLGTNYSNPDQSVWIIGGDGWAYDIGYGGLDHVINSGENVNILVLDTEVYSNTGGQASKSTPRGAMVKFASAGKHTKKKDLISLVIASKNCYVAGVSLGANMGQCIKAFKEAEAFNGPSIIVAYSPCVNHGFDMSTTMAEMKSAVDCGYWTLVRYNPNEGVVHLDSTGDYMKYEEFLNSETRYSSLKEMKKADAEKLLNESKLDAMERVETLKAFSKKVDN